MRKPKVYPLNPWEYEGYAASWGNHNDADFLIALATHLDLHVPTGVVVYHGYARLLWCFEEKLMMVHHADGPGRGVRPITEIFL